jgi:hypothetical protein
VGINAKVDPVVLASQQQDELARLRAKVRAQDYVLHAVIANAGRLVQYNALGIANYTMELPTVGDWAQLVNDTKLEVVTDWERNKVVLSLDVRWTEAGIREAGKRFTAVEEVLAVLRGLELSEAEAQGLRDAVNSRVRR